MARDLAVSVMRAVEPEWKRLDVENRSSSAINELRNDFEVISPEISGTHGADFGLEWRNGGPQETNLQVVLRRKDSADRLLIRLILPFENEKVANLGLFSATITGYKNTVLQVPWLKSFVETSRTPVWLRFVKNRSFSAKAFSTFSQDMKSIGRSDLIAAVEKYREESALVSVGGGLDYYQSYWIVLPDKKVILWRDSYKIAAPEWKSTLIEHHECAEPRSGGPACVGALISEAGVLIDQQR